MAYSLYSLSSPEKGGGGSVGGVHQRRDLRI